MLNKQPADDLFEKSSMSFGEHLEELRNALLKAFIWLGAGTAIGLFFADRIILHFQGPLEQAIRDYHVKQATDDFREANAEEPTDELAAVIREKSLTPEISYVDPEIFSLALIVDEVSAPPTPDDESKTSGDVDKETATNSDEVEAEENTSGEDNGSIPSIEHSEADENPWEGVTSMSLNRLKPVILWRPIATNLVSLNVTEGFMIWLKAGLLAGVVIGSPGIFWHIWQFFAAGLYPHERRYVYWYLPLSLLLFLAGVSLAFFVIFRLVIGFLMNYTAPLGVEFTPRLHDYMSFALFLPLGFGIAFQLPLVMLGLHRFGLVSVELFVSQWRIAVLAIAFLSMILTPAEIYSMIGLFVPLTGLYFLGILLCKYMPKGAGVGSAALDPQD